MEVTAPFNYRLLMKCQHNTDRAHNDATSTKRNRRLSLKRVSICIALCISGTVAVVSACLYSTNAEMITSLFLLGLGALTGGIYWMFPSSSHPSRWYLRLVGLLLGVIAIGLGGYYLSSRAGRQN